LSVHKIDLISLKQARLKFFHPYVPAFLAHKC